MSVCVDTVDCACVGIEFAAALRDWVTERTTCYQKTGPKMLLLSRNPVIETYALLVSVMVAEVRG